jgi:predicted ester cyclase
MSLASQACPEVPDDAGLPGGGGGGRLRGADPAAAGGGTGVQAIKEMVVARLYRAFPDLHITLDDLIEEGDRVVERDTVTGTHTGEFNGLEPTGKSVSYSEIFIMRFANGRIAEIWGVVDIFTQMKQLGLIPA